MSNSIRVGFYFFTFTRWITNILHFTFLTACWDRSACIPYGFIQPVKTNWEFILYFLYNIFWWSSPKGKVDRKLSSRSTKSQWIPNRNKLSCVTVEYCLPVSQIWRYTSRYPVLRVLYWCWVGWLQHPISLWVTKPVSTRETSVCFLKIWEEITGV